MKNSRFFNVLLSFAICFFSSKIATRLFQFTRELISTRSASILVSIEGQLSPCPLNTKMDAAVEKRDGLAHFLQTDGKSF
jgi:hypothetical protein